MFGLITRLSVMFGLPVVSIFNKAHAGVYYTAVSQYPNELIILLSVVMMVVGCLASIVAQDPEGAKPISPLTKFVYSVFGSCMAFVYLVFYAKEISLIHAFWVGGVSFVAPAVVPSAKTLVFDLLPVAHKAIKGVVTGIIEKWSGGKGNSNE